MEATNIILSIDLGKRNLGWCLLEHNKNNTSQTHILDIGLFDIDNEINSQTKQVTITKKLKKGDVTKEVTVKRFKDTPIAISRPTVLLEFLDSFKENYVNKVINKIIVEKQNINNPLAMCLQSVIITYALMNNIEIVSFDPKVKFSNASKTFVCARSAGINNISQLNTSHKEHKKLVVDMAREAIENYSNDEEHKEELVKNFNSNNKKDDVSDAIIQAIVSIL